jgi:hypothetical protein
MAGHGSNDKETERNMLNRLAAAQAAEIKHHYWRDVHIRVDRAGHQPEDDKKQPDEEKLLSLMQAENVLTNVAFVTGQLHAWLDPSMDIHEYALACGVPHKYAAGGMHYGLRRDGNKVLPPYGFLDEETSPEETDS